MRAFLKPARRLVNLGATIVVLHNDGKSESARDYRGSAAFKDAVDVAFHVSNSERDGLLQRLTVRPYKHRFGFTGELTYTYSDGLMLPAGAASTAARTSRTRDIETSLFQLLSDKPGINTRDFLRAAASIHVPDRQARNYLHSGVTNRRIRREGTPSTGYRHFAIESGGLR
jgi:hypothetical protein